MNLLSRTRVNYVILGIMGENIPLIIALTEKAKVSMHAPPCRADQDIFV